MQGCSIQLHYKVCCCSYQKLDQCSGRNPWKKDASTVVFMDAKHWEDPHRWVWGLIVVRCLSPQGRCLCGSVVGKLAGPAGTPTCCRLIPSTVSWVTWGRRILAVLHTGIPWKHRLVLKHSGTNQALWIYRQISFVFPSFMGKAGIAVPYC